MRIAVAMSGGVDSLRTATLLKEGGHEVFGLHMRLLPSSRQGLWNAGEEIQKREENLHRLCRSVDLPLMVLDLREAFEAIVIRPFVESYRQGLTPNPCIWCNPTIKFGRLMEEAGRLGAEALATGHYARVEPPGSSSGRFRLLRGLDETKDQSYFLYGLTQEQLAFARFPLGEAIKQETLRWAKETGFSASLPGESQEICFIPSGNYGDFLCERMAPSEDGSNLGAGIIRDVEGRILGRHRGLWAYTIGQRRGLRLPSTEPYYVVALEAATNTVRVGRREDLLRQRLTAGNLNWISMDAPDDLLRCAVRIRYRHTPAMATLTPSNVGHIAVQFDEPQRAITPGQAAVFYDGDVVLGGGTILP